MAPLAAPDCTVRGVGGESPNLCDVSTVWIQPANPIRQMSGREAVTVTIHTPSGLAFNSPVKFEQANSRFASPIFWVEPGRATQIVHVARHVIGTRHSTLDTRQTDFTF
jgi:filamin